MRLDELRVTADSIQAAGWEAILEDCLECARAHDALGQAGRVAEAAKDTERLHAIAFLQAVTSLYLDLDKTDPLQPLMQDPQGRTPSVDNFTDDHLDVLKAFAPGISHAGLRSRIADILWHRRRDHEMARLALDAYLDLVDSLVATGKLNAVREYLERALQIASHLRDSELKQRVRDRVEILLSRKDPNDPQCLAASLMEILLGDKFGDPEKYAAVAEEHANRTAAIPNTTAARSYWELAARWHRRANNESGAQAAATQAAETFVADAESHLAGGSGGAFAAAEFLTRAIEAFRRISGSKERVSSLQKRLAEVQPLIGEAMKEHSVTIDLGDVISQATGKVRGKSKIDALRALAQVARPRSLSAMRMRAADAAMKYPLTNLFGTIHLDSDGRIRGRTAPFPTDPESREQALTDRVLQDSVREWGIAVAGQIEPARRVVVEEHRVLVLDIYHLSGSCPFIPPGREWTFARGLHAGLDGDFAVAASLLVPQVENCLRYLLTCRGEITTKLDPDRIEEDYGLGALLATNETLRGALKNTIGEDLLFELRALLIEKTGGNLRNMLAHGMLDDGQIGSELAAYAWWLIYWLCIKPGLWGPQTDPERPTQASSSPQ